MLNLYISKPADMITLTKLQRNTWHQRIPEIIAALFILLFTYTALSKIWEFERFQSVLSSSPLLGTYSGTLAVLIPVTELAVSLLLFLPRSRRIGLVFSLVLMILFTVYISYMILFTPHLPCSCGGVIKKLTWSEHLAFNSIFILLGILGIIPDKLFVATNRGNRKPVKE